MIIHHLTLSFWLGLAAFLLIIEMLLGSGFLLCMACSAGFMFILKLLFGLHSLGLQIFLFSFNSVIFAVIWKILLARRPFIATSGKLNQRAQQYIGREFKLTETVHGEGKMPVDDTIWLVRSAEAIPACNKVVVTGVDGIILLIKKK